MIASLTYNLSILNPDNPIRKSGDLIVMCNHYHRLVKLITGPFDQSHNICTGFRVEVPCRYCFISTINILWLSTQLSSICGQNKSKAAHCPSCFSFTPKLSTLFFDVFNQLRIAADEISVKRLVHWLSVHFHHMCDNLFCECCCTSDSVIAP